MIYASDIDRTLTYSEDFLKDNPENLRYELLLADESKKNSYISRDVAVLLSRITSKESGIRFIPVTTRSIAEFQRIKFRSLGINVEYAITSNGGTILYHGEILREWKEQILSQISKDEIESALSDLDSLESINYSSKLIDNVFLFSKTSDASLADIELDSMRKKYPQFNFKRYKSKIYVLPNIISKDNALNWLRHYLNEDKVVASGDSSFDVPMLISADISVIPSHSVIDDEDLKKFKYSIANGGVQSPLETIRIAMKHL